MRLFSGVKYELIGFRRVLDGYYWVLHERSKSFNMSTAYIIVNECKFVNDGNVYFLFDDGRIESGHRVIQVPQLAYEYN